MKEALERAHWPPRTRPDPVALKSLQALDQFLTQARAQLNISNDDTMEIQSAVRTDIELIR